MFLYVWGYNWNSQCTCGKVMYNGANEYGTIEYCSACTWIVPGTIETSLG
jgi:hypothetical protein